MKEFDEASFNLLFKRVAHEYFQSIIKYPKTPIKVETLDAYWVGIPPQTVSAELTLIEKYERYLTSEEIKFSKEMLDHLECYSRL